MKVLGIILVVVGFLWAIVAFNIDVTVDGVNNFGLMDQRHNNIIFAGITILVGAVFIGFGSISKAGSKAGITEQDVDLRACPYCAELIMREAIVCKHCGRDVPAQTTQQHTPVSPAQADIHELCMRLRAEGLTYQQYQQLAQASGATLGLSGGSIFAKYVVTHGGNEVVIKKFDDLKPWFLRNIVPLVESQT
ncbi:MAG: zinc ribbon domain-containing protein [Sulfuricaulis sp.]